MVERGHDAKCELSRAAPRCFCRGRRYGRIFKISLLIGILEISGGMYARSLALLSDAIHALADGLAYKLNQLFEKEASKHPEREQRVQQRSAIINAFLLWIVAAWVGYEAVVRILAPEAVFSGVMLIVAVLDLALNVWQLSILHGISRMNRNRIFSGMDAHVQSDLLQSTGVIIAGLGIWFSGWQLFDPLMSLGISARIAYMGAGLICGGKGRGHAGHRHHGEK